MAWCRFNGCVYQVYVRKRPYLDYFLETVSKSFEVVVFTASQSVYADVLLDKLDPGRKHVQHRLFREACLLVQGNYLKDLTVINRDLKQVVIVVVVIIVCACCYYCYCCFFTVSYLIVRDCDCL